jgi:hypothetical protein
MKLESKANGTQFTAYGQVEFGFITKVAGGLLSKLMDKQLNAEANALKLLLESGHQVRRRLPAACRHNIHPRLIKGRVFSFTAVSL